MIEKVDEPTNWGSQIEVIKKMDSGLCMCIDPQPFNKAFLREWYPLPVLEDILPNLERAMRFTKADLDSAF